MDKNTEFTEVRYPKYRGEQEANLDFCVCVFFNVALAAMWGKKRHF